MEHVILEDANSCSVTYTYMQVELGIELRGDLTVEEENFLRSQIDERMEKTKNLQK